MMAQGGGLDSSQLNTKCFIDDSGMYKKVLSWAILATKEKAPG